MILNAFAPIGICFALGEGAVSVMRLLVRCDVPCRLQRMHAPRPPFSAPPAGLLHRCGESCAIDRISRP
jgi:hypothetical protein